MLWTDCLNLAVSRNVDCGSVQRLGQNRTRVPGGSAVRGRVVHMMNKEAFFERRLKKQTV